MRAAVAILRDYRQLLDLYQVEQVRAVATSAVREASNCRHLPRPRLHGHRAEPRGHRHLRGEPADGLGRAPGGGRCAGGRTAARRLIADVGGGSTLLTLLHDGEIVTSQSLRLGSIRLQEMLSTSEEPPERSAELLRSHIANVIAAVARLAAAGRRADVRGRGRRRPLRRPRRRQADRIGRPLSSSTPTGSTSSSAAASATRPRSWPSATGCPSPRPRRSMPALLGLPAPAARNRGRGDDRLARLDARRPAAGAGPARDRRGGPSRSREGVIHSAMAIAEKYRVDLEHAAERGRRCRSGCSTSCRRSTAWGRGTGCCLHVAALLHEVGAFVSSSAHHKHSYYLIANSEIFGLEPGRRSSWSRTSPATIAAACPSRRTWSTWRCRANRGWS